jgi:hypothetical protein
MDGHAVEQPAQTSAGLGASALAGTPADRILDELDTVVRNSYRRSVVGRMLHRAGRAFAALLSRGVSEQPPPPSDLPNEIWFPWFLL